MKEFIDNGISFFSDSSEMSFKVTLGKDLKTFTVDKEVYDKMMEFIKASYEKSESINDLAKRVTSYFGLKDYQCSMSYNDNLNCEISCGKNACKNDNSECLNFMICKYYGVEEKGRGMSFIWDQKNSRFLMEHSNYTDSFPGDEFNKSKKNFRKSSLILGYISFWLKYKDNDVRKREFKSQVKKSYGPLLFPLS